MFSLKQKKNIPYTIYHIPYTHRGFTMIELLVTVSIFALVSSVLLANYPRFSSKILLENTAHIIGLSVRQAQTYGLNVRGVKVGGADVFPTYGIHFRTEEDVNSGDPANGSTFLLFADIVGDEGQPGLLDPTENNKRYDPSPSGCSVIGGECTDLFTIQSRERIVLLCGIKGGETAEDCSLTYLDAVYTRPSPDASIKGYSVDTGQVESFGVGKVIVQSPRGDRKAVVIRNTGQITVE